MGFDVGKILANLLLMYFACDGHATGARLLHCGCCAVLC
jgi:5-methylthioribose kinase